jgi:hypothetical protein
LSSCFVFSFFFFFQSPFFKKRGLRLLEQRRLDRNTPLDDWEAVATVQQYKLLADAPDSIADACCNCYDLLKRHLP